MNSPSDASEQFSFSSPSVGAVLPDSHPFLWSVRRELWENRSITIAPLLVTGLILFAISLSLFALPRRMRNLPRIDPARQHAVVVEPFSVAPAPIMLTTFLVGMFYCLDALYGERRDRSILFWKSLPVSDRTTVLSKASIPLVVLPLTALMLSVATVIILLFEATAVLLANGMSPVRLWTEVRFIEEALVMLYGMTVHTLWFAPIYGWLLLVSAWARRAPLLWATLPIVAIGLAERLAFQTTYVALLLKYRFAGAMIEAFGGMSPQHGHKFDMHLTPGRFLSAPGLWVGLAFAAVCLLAAVKLRRSREPL